MPRPEEVSLLVEDAKLIFMNFKGEEKRFNREGDRNFSLILDEQSAVGMLEDGWNVKRLKDRELDGEVLPGDYYMQVSVKYKFKPPRIIMITGQTRLELTEDLVSMLDDVEIVYTDLIVNKVHYDVNGNTGFKAYLKKAFITVEQDALDLKYAQNPGDL